MRKGDDFYNLLADKLTGAMRSGRHTHRCPKCGGNKECPLITHCRRKEESYCSECLAEIANPKG
jgi:hypothetical protein